MEKRFTESEALGCAEYLATKGMEGEAALIRQLVNDFRTYKAVKPSDILRSFAARSDQKDDFTEEEMENVLDSVFPSVAEAREYFINNGESYKQAYEAAIKDGK